MCVSVPQKEGNFNKEVKKLFNYRINRMSL